jgi:hypothetical protein
MDSLLRRLCAPRSKLVGRVAAGSAALLVAGFAGCTASSSSDQLSPQSGPGNTPDGSAPPVGTGDPDAAPPPQKQGGFDYQAFQTLIQPILDTAAGKGCTASACHGAPGGQAGFALTRQPGINSNEMQANFTAVTNLCNINVPDQSPFYLRATTLHAGGSSAVVSQAQASTILQWIQSASGVVTPPPPTPGTDAGTPPGGANCLAASNFNLGVFSAEVLPILLGQLDYNSPPGQPIAFDGCSRSVCHGTDRGAGTLFISAQNSPQQNLNSFACFIDAKTPSGSPILQCPLNAACPKSPHPGQNVFRNPTDLNYQRVLSYLYATKTVANPIDFAYFARVIEPVFDDPNFGGLGNTGQRTCADTSSCHGVTSPLQAPPNLSNFPMLANASSKQQLLINYWQAANFANFLTPQGSELFLFPTDLISDVTQPYALGIHHPGGIDFGADSKTAAASAQGQAILQWTGGLRPDGNGNQLNWLVAGTYSIANVTEQTTVGNEGTVAPAIFDPDGASQFNNGQWDVLASPNVFVDLNTAFPGAAGGGRAAYAVAYAMNTTSADIQNANITVTSPNAIELFIDGHPIAQASQAGNNTISGIATLPASSAQTPSTRMMVKVFQRAADAQFGFTLNMQTQFNVPLTNTSGELVFRLDSRGGL